MIVHYHELSALMGVGTPGQQVTLNDLHKAAWALYTGTGKMEIPKGVERPFTFRADEMPGRPGMYLLIVRSPFAFANAKPASLDLSAGLSLTIEFMYSPFLRTKNAQGKTIRTTPPRDAWPDNARQRLQAAGLEPETVAVTHLPQMRVKARQKPQPLVMVEATATVTDPVAVADKWIRGATPMRAYGMGQFTLLPDSASQAQAV